MNLLWIIVIVLVVLAVGGHPGIIHHPYGYYPSGGLGLIVLVILILWLIGVFR